MDKLRKFYTKMMLAVVATVASLAVINTTFIIPLATVKYGVHARATWVARHATDGHVIPFVLLAFEIFVRKVLWRIVHPRLDFDGQWAGYTNYTGVPIGRAEVGEGKGSGQTVTFKQDCLNLRLSPSRGLDFEFESTAIEIREDGEKLVYAYLVTYTPGTANRPDEAHGYESLSVEDPGGRRRPSRMEGWFAHCARGQTPVLNGRVLLVRQPTTGFRGRLGTFWRRITLVR